jgi:uncharacterized protein (TIGR00297 family)
MAFAHRKRDVSANFAKGGRRDWAQVTANAGAAILCLVFGATGWIPQPLAWIAFTASMAAVTADTWATELGVLSAAAPILITTGRRMPPGTSGGVSFLGSASALSAGLLITVVAWLLGLVNLAMIPLVTLPWGQPCKRYIIALHATRKPSAIRCIPAERQHTGSAVCAGSIMIG